MKALDLADMKPGAAGLVKIQSKNRYSVTFTNGVSYLLGDLICEGKAGDEVIVSIGDGLGCFGSLKSIKNIV